jgi:hypothetical protein
MLSLLASALQDRSVLREHLILKDVRSGRTLIRVDCNPRINAAIARQAKSVALLVLLLHRVVVPRGSSALAVQQYRQSSLTVRIITRPLLLGLKRALRVSTALQAPFGHCRARKARSQIRLGFRIRTTALRAPQGSIALGKVSLKPAEIAMLGTIALVVPQRPTLRMALSETSVLLEARAQRDRLITRRAELVHPLSTRRVSVLLCVIRAL